MGAATSSEAVRKVSIDTRSLSIIKTEYSTDEDINTSTSSSPEQSLKRSWEAANHDNSEYECEEESLTKLGNVQNLHMDGYRWRKYGERESNEDESQRSYYRCTFIGYILKNRTHPVLSET